MGNCNSERQLIGQPSMTPQPLSSSIIMNKPEPYTFKVPEKLNSKVQTYTFMKGKVTDNIAKIQPIISIERLNDLQQQIKGKYTDEQFKADMSSIGQNLNIQKIQWKRPKQLNRKVQQFFNGQIESDQIKQGKIQNLYFLSSLAAFEHEPQYIQRILQNEEMNQKGIYGVWLFIDGQWKNIIVDDLFAAVYEQYIFSKHKNELWIMLLEKAYAKAFKSYQNIKYGFVGYFLSAITGAPYEYLIKNYNLQISPDKGWEFLKNAFKKKYILIATTENSEDFLQQGKYSYPIIDCQEVYTLTPTNKRKERIIKMKNSWGRYEWKGRWSQYSDVWSQELRHQLNFEKADEEIIWINIEDFLYHFGQVCVCKYNKAYINSSLSLKFKQIENQFKGVYLNIEQRFEGVLNFIQKDFRHFLKNYSYSSVRVIILQLHRQSKKIKKVIKEVVGKDYYLSTEVQLDPGLYYFLLELDWSCGFSRDLVVNLYGNVTTNIVQDPQKMDQKKVESLFYEISFAKNQQDKGKNEQYLYEQDKKIKRTYSKIGGYLFVHYFNNSKNNKNLFETVKLDKNSELQVCNSKKKDEYFVKLAPGEQMLIKLKIKSEKYSFDPVFSHKIIEKFNKEELVELVKKRPNKIKKRDIEGEQIQVYIKTFNYSGGVVLFYENRLKNKTYIEQIEFQMKNLKLEHESLGEQMKLQIELQPHSQKLLSFVLEDLTKDFAFRTKVSYYLADPQFKF